MKMITKARSCRRMLIIEDDVAVRTALCMSFQRENWIIDAAASCSEARRKFDPGAPQIVVSDVRLPDGDGVALMREFRSRNNDCRYLLLTAYSSVPQAVEAVRQGACDYLQKPVPFAELRAAVDRICKASVSVADESTSHAIIGESPALLSSLQRARQAAHCDADILIEAESGTGKELLARLVHQESVRRSRPFVAVNCAALPETLLEAELFGHARGAFTGADAQRIGKFEAANGGTLLLDEIGEIPLGLQPKLLRVLQEREFDRLGESRPVRVDVRVIATTNRALCDLVAQGSFRLDLYYRLNVIPLTLPPLRERGEDVVLLARHFMKTIARGKSSKLSDRFIDALRGHDWPGNVRELANLMRRVGALCFDDEVGPEQFETPTRRTSAETVLGPGTSLRHAERRLLEATLAATDGNRTRTAELLGVSLRTVRNKIRDFGLPPRRYA